MPPEVIPPAPAEVDPNLEFFQSQARIVLQRFTPPKRRTLSEPTHSRADTTTSLVAPPKKAKRHNSEHQSTGIPLPFEGRDNSLHWTQIPGHIELGLDSDDEVRAPVALGISKIIANNDKSLLPEDAYHELQKAPSGITGDSGESVVEKEGEVPSGTEIPENQVETKKILDYHKPFSEISAQDISSRNGELRRTYTPDQTMKTSGERVISFVRGDILRETAPVLIDVPRNMSVPPTGIRSHIWKSFPKLEDRVFSSKKEVGDFVPVNPKETDGIPFIFLLTRHTEKYRAEEDKYLAAFSAAIKYLLAKGYTQLATVTPMVFPLNRDAEKLRETLYLMTMGTALKIKVYVDVNNANLPDKQIIFERVGDVTTAKTPIVHCVSADLTMSKGVAEQLVSKFPMLKSIRSGPSPQMGDVITLWQSEWQPITIFNLVTKLRYDHKPTTHTLEKTLRELLRIVKRNNIHKLSLPRIGCGLDKLDWEETKILLGKVFEDSGVVLVVFNLPVKNSPKVKTG